MRPIGEHFLLWDHSQHRWRCRDYRCTYTMSELEMNKIFGRIVATDDGKTMFVRVQYGD